MIGVEEEVLTLFPPDIFIPVLSQDNLRMIMILPVPTPTGQPQVTPCPQSYYGYNSIHPARLASRTFSLLVYLLLNTNHTVPIGSSV